MQEADRLSAWGGRGLPCAQIGALLVHPPHQYPGPQRSGPPGSRWGWGQRGAACSSRPGAAPPQPGLSRQGRGRGGRPCRTPGPFNSSLAPTRARGQRASRTPTVALASAALAFFSRALQASKSRRRFWRSRLSFCGGENGDQGDAGQPWEAPGRSGMAMATGPSGRHRRTGPDRGVDHARPLGAPGPQQGRPQEGKGPAREESPGSAALRRGPPGSPARPLTEMVFQSPSRKLRRGVRKLMEAVWIKSLSAAPRRFSASATLISVFPEGQREG